jgi:hypothetical protein
MVYVKINKHTPFVSSDNIIGIIRYFGYYNSGSQYYYVYI